MTGFDRFPRAMLPVSEQSSSNQTQPVDEGLSLFCRISVPQSVSVVKVRCQIASYTLMEAENKDPYPRRQYDETERETAEWRYAAFEFCRQ